MVMWVMSVNGGAAGRLSAIMFPPEIVRIPTLKRTYDIILAGILLRGLQRKKMAARDALITIRKTVTAVKA